MQYAIYNNNPSFGDTGPFEAKSFAELADDLNAELHQWSEETGKTIKQLEADLVSGLSLVCPVCGEHGEQGIESPSCDCLIQIYRGGGAKGEPVHGGYASKPIDPYGCGTLLVQRSLSECYAWFAGDDCRPDKDDLEPAISPWISFAVGWGYSEREAKRFVLDVLDD